MSHQGLLLSYFFRVSKGNCHQTQHLQHLQQYECMYLSHIIYDIIFQDPRIAASICQFHQSATTKSYHLKSNGRVVDSSDRLELYRICEQIVVNPARAAQPSTSSVIDGAGGASSVTRLSAFRARTISLVSRHCPCGGAADAYAGYLHIFVSLNYGRDFVDAMVLGSRYLLFLGSLSTLY